MRKRIIACLITLLILFNANVVWGWTVENSPPWGISYQELREVERGLLRTYDGLNKEQRSRIAKYFKILDFSGYKVKVYFSFKSNKLFEMEYSFFKPTQELLKQIAIKFSKKYGKPKKAESLDRPEGSPFSKRSYSDMLWDVPNGQVNIRWNANSFIKKYNVKSLFITFRQNEPKKVEKKIEKQQKAIVTFTGLITPDTKTQINTKELKALLDKSDYTLGTINLIDKEKPSKNKELYGRLKKSGVDFYSFVLKGKNSSTKEDIKKNLEIDSLVMFGKEEDKKSGKHVFTKDINGIQFGFVGYKIDLEGIDSEEALFKFNSKLTNDVITLSNKVDVVIVQIYWGKVGKNCINKYQPLVTEAAIKSGASVLIGYSNDFIQTVKIENQKLIAFSSGTLISKENEYNEYTEDSVGTDYKNISLIVLASFSKKGLEGYNAFPVLTKKVDGVLTSVLIKGSERAELSKALSKWNVNCTE